MNMGAMYIEDVADLLENSALNLELGTRVTGSIIMENHLLTPYKKMESIRLHAAVANNLCVICYRSAAGSLRDPNLCVSCSFVAHAEGYN